MLPERSPSNIFSEPVLVVCCRRQNRAQHIVDFLHLPGQASPSFPNSSHAGKLCGGVDLTARQKQKFGDSNFLSGVCSLARKEAPKCDRD